jgi:hypothetical protein
VRLARAQGFGVATTATSSLITTGGDDGALLTAVGAPNPVVGDFQFIYDGIANGLNDGRDGALALDLSSFTSVAVTVAITGAATAQLTLWSSALSASSSLLPLVNGTNNISLGTFGTLNLTDIQAMRVFVQGVNALDTVTVTAIAAVPEPGTGLLISAGLIALALRRRQR